MSIEWSNHPTAYQEEQQQRPCAITRVISISMYTSKIQQQVELGFLRLGLIYRN